MQPTAFIIKHKKKWRGYQTEQIKSMYETYANTTVNYRTEYNSNNETFSIISFENKNKVIKPEGNKDCSRIDCKYYNNKGGTIILDNNYEKLEYIDVQSNILIKLMRTYELLTSLSCYELNCNEIQPSLTNLEFRCPASFNNFNLFPKLTSLWIYYTPKLNDIIDSLPTLNSITINLEYHSNITITTKNIKKVELESRYGSLHNVVIDSLVPINLLITCRGSYDANNVKTLDISRVSEIKLSDNTIMNVETLKCRESKIIKDKLFKMGKLKRLEYYGNNLMMPVNNIEHLVIQGKNVNLSTFINLKYLKLIAYNDHNYNINIPTLETLVLDNANIKDINCPSLKRLSLLHSDFNTIYAPFIESLFVNAMSDKLSPELINIIKSKNIKDIIINGKKY